MTRRGNDICQLVELLNQNNKNTIGIIGSDLFDEYNLSNTNSKLKVLFRYEWNDKNMLFGKPTLCLLGKKNIAFTENKPIGIPNKYKETAKRFLSENNQYIFGNQFYFDGGCEENIDLGIYDYAIDIVATGKTLKRTNLEIITTINKCDILVVACTRGKNE